MTEAAGEKMPEKIDPTARKLELVEGKFGQETVERMQQTSRRLYASMLERATQIGLGEGSSSQQRQAVEQYLSMWDEFTRAVGGRINQGGKAEKEMEIAVKGATGFMMAGGRVTERSAEPRYSEALEEFKKAAR